MDKRGRQAVGSQRVGHNRVTKHEHTARGVVYNISYFQNYEEKFFLDILYLLNFHSMY